jgi:hypothetical protein
MTRDAGRDGAARTPHHNMRCQCPEEGKLQPDMAGWYDEETELPYVTHAPGECECTNDVALYRRGERELLLCSCCHRFGEERIEWGHS